MKALIKYTIRADMSGRLIAFAAIFVMNLAFIIPGLFGLLPLAAQITAVSLSGTAIGVMSVFNIIGDISIIRSMFFSPGAVFYAITPAPRKKRLCVGLTTMFLTDFITMTFSIVSVVILALILGNDYVDGSIWVMASESFPHIAPNVIIPIAQGVVYYLFVMMLIIFGITMRKSVFYSKRAGGLLAFLVAIGIYYLSTVSALLVAPFGHVSFFFGFITVTVGYLGMGLYVLLILLFAVALFILTARLLERKLNI